MRVRVKRRVALAASALFLGACFIIYLITEMTMLPHEDSPRVQQSKQVLLNEEIDDSSSFRFKRREFIQSSLSANVTSTLRSAAWMEQNQQCSPLESPNAEIQMLDLYKEINFDNIDGGVWKQGWNIEYNVNQWSLRKKLKVFVVPHSHNDPGWLKTFENYFTAQTRHILNNMVTKLSEDSRRKFIWAEISFFSMWWDTISQDVKDKVKLLIESGQLELVTAGWVMNDEANTHYFNMLTQLTQGHQWVLQNLGVKPKNSWSIDPFGQSPSMAFILQRSGLSNLLIQRVHYSVKKVLARRRQLEFRWRQPWDTSGSLDLFTHMMPFYSYDVPHTCGPDPKICCQFDFKRLQGYGVSCPWKVPPRVITKSNVAERAELLLDQYRKKSQLYRTNVVLAPLGDDFRYDHSSEWDNQYKNYQKIFDYFKSKPKLHVEASFGTLEDYFEAVREEMTLNEFPTLSGDFFTYADRDDHYWSGYYTSRPFYKRMDRVVMSYLRSAELLFALAWGERIHTDVPAVNSVHSWLLTSRAGLLQLLEVARRHVSIFQHHDGVTGTARDNVVEDYGRKLLEAIQGCQNVIQMSAYALLASRQEVGVPERNTVFFTVDDKWNDHYSLPEKTTIALGPNVGVESRRVVVFNSLSWRRLETIYLRVSTPYIKVTDSKGQIVSSQTNPVFQMSGMSESRFELVFVADVAPLALTTYTLTVSDAKDFTSKNTISEIRLFNTINKVFSIAPDFSSQTKVVKEPNEFSVVSEKLSAAFSAQGLLKALTLRETGYTVPLHLDFAKYGARTGDERSGAYLFLPDGEAQVINVKQPLVRVIEGPIMSRVEVDLIGVTHTLTLHNSPGIDSIGLDIVNNVDITQFADFEMVMRVSSNIHSNDEFFTDLNGLQMIKRKQMPKIPLQGNYYPLPSQVFIQDAETRLSILSAQPLGVSSLLEGQIEVMQDRRLLHDDNRGLGQGVEDNRLTRTAFRLLLERRKPSCKDDNLEVPASSLISQLALNSLLHPLHKLTWRNQLSTNIVNDFAPIAVHNPPSLDLHLVSLRTFTSLPSPLPPGQATNQSSESVTAGIVLHRFLVDSCFPTTKGFIQTPKSSNMVSVNNFFPNHFGPWLQPASLSFLHSGSSQDRSIPQPFCSQDMRAFILSQ